MNRKTPDFSGTFEWAYPRRLAQSAKILALSGKTEWVILPVLVQFIIDIALFQILVSFKYAINLSQIISLLGAVLLSYSLYSLRYSPYSETGWHLPQWRRFLTYLIVMLMALFLRGGMLTLVINHWGITPRLAIIIAAMVSSLTVHVGVSLFFSQATSQNAYMRRYWRLALLSIIAYLILFRLVYIGLPELLPEEAYYWNYSQHPALGYLDHPPMVAWIINAGTIIFGNNEFGVRLGAFLCWLATAFFSFRLAREMFDGKTGFNSLLLVSALPFFISVGALMTPDAPLSVCWAGALYYLYCALIKEKAKAWWGAGLFIGLGMLSKYTIALLIPAVFIYILIDSNARKWLYKPQPYLAAILALILFSPVIIWNAENNWISFAFQTTRRVAGEIHFSPHLLFASILVLITPTGVLAAIPALFTRKNKVSRGKSESSIPHRRRLFVLIFTLTPLAVFTLFSLWHEPKLNWTGPIWLAVLPVIANMITRPLKSYSNLLFSIGQKLWLPTIVILVLFYGAALHYLVCGFPHIPYPRSIMSIAGWKDLQKEANEIRRSVSHRSSLPSLITGLDKYNISSELAFYGYPEGPRITAGSHLFDHESLMYRLWFPDSSLHGRMIIMFADAPGGLNEPQVTDRFNSMSEISEFPIRLNGVFIGNYYYRVGYAYKPKSLLSPPDFR
jgi:dolichol-phosphate mannosyltransferase